MLRRLHTLTLLASGLFVAACGDSRAPTSPQLQIGTGPACSPTNVKKYAKALYGTTGTLYSLAQQFTPSNANSRTATNLFFDMAAVLADSARSASLPEHVSLTEDQKSNLANLLIQGIACANVSISDADYATLSDADRVANFVAAAGPTGGLEVRGRPSPATGQNDPIYTHNKNQNGSAGIAPPTGKTFADWYGDRVMFYGFPFTGTSSSEALPPNGRVAFQWFAVWPAYASFNPNALSGKVSICVISETDFDASQLRIEHDLETILPVTDFHVPCGDPSFLRFGATQPTSGLGSALAWLRQKLLPEPLLAAALTTRTSPSGSPKSLSPVEVINPLGATLTYEPAPSDGKVSQGLGIKVHATGSGGTDWEGLLIKISAQDNNGRFVAVSPDTATTDASGLANFTTSKINKTGVYQLLAVTQPGPDQDATGFTPDSVLSGNFHRFPK